MASKNSKKKKKKLIRNWLISMFCTIICFAVAVEIYYVFKIYIFDDLQLKQTSTGTQNENSTKPNGNKIDNNSSSNDYTTILAHTDDVSDDYFDNTIFLGDSRTVAMVNHNILKEENTFAVTGISHISFMTHTFQDSVTGMKGDIFKILKARKPERVYIALGVNGVAFIEEEKFVSTFQEFVARIQSAVPDCIIVIESIMPVTREGTFSNNNLNNENITNMNKNLLNIAKEQQVYYLDVAGVIMDEDGKMADEYDTGDGLHFNESACNMIYGYMCCHGAY